LENAAHHLGLYKNTLEQYLRSSKLGSDSFKIKLTKLYNVDFDSLYLSPTQQISACVQEAYKQFDVLPRNDLNLLEEVKQAASKYDHLKEYGYSVFLLGVQQRHEGLLHESVKNLCKAYTLFDDQHLKSMQLTTLMQLIIINTSSFHRYHDNIAPDYVIDFLKKFRLVSLTFSKQLTLQSLVVLLITKAKALYENTFHEEQRLHFLYFATLGYAYGALNDFEASLSYCNTALQYTTGKRSMPVLVNKGVAFYNLGHSDQSLENLSKALTIVDNDDPRIYYIFMKIWDVLRSIGDIEMSNTYWEMVDIDEYFNLKYGYFHYFEQMILYGTKHNDDDFILKTIDLMSKKFNLNSYTHHNTIKLMTHIGTLIESDKFTTSMLEIMKTSLTRNFLIHPNLTEPIRGATFKLLGIIQFKTNDDFAYQI